MSLQVNKYLTSASVWGLVFFFSFSQNSWSWPQVPGAEFKATAVQSRVGFPKYGIASGCCFLCVMGPHCHLLLSPEQ